MLGRRSAFTTRPQYGNMSFLQLIVRGLTMPKHFEPSRMDTLDHQIIAKLHTPFLRLLQEFPSQAAALEALHMDGPKIAGEVYIFDSLARCVAWLDLPIAASEEELEKKTAQVKDDMKFYIYQYFVQHPAKKPTSVESIAQKNDQQKIRDSGLQSGNFELNLSLVTLLVVLKTLALRQANAQQIKTALEAFCMQGHASSKQSDKKPPTLAQIFKALDEEITEEVAPYPENVEKAVKANRAKLDTLKEVMAQKYGTHITQALSTLMTKDAALSDRNNPNGRLFQLAASLTEIDKEKLDEELNYYYAMTELLASDVKRTAHIIASRERQTKENKENRSWAEKNLRHFALLECMKKNEETYAAIQTLTGITGNNKTSHENIAQLYAPCESIDQSIFQIIHKMAIDAGAKDLFNLDGKGRPHGLYLSEQDEFWRDVRVTAMCTFVGVLIMFSFLSILGLTTDLAKKPLAALYTTVFSGMGMISPNHYFSFNDVYLLNIAFTVAIDALVFMVCRRIAKNDEKEIIFNHTIAYPKAMETKICDFVDEQCNDLVKDGTQRTVLLSWYKEEANKQMPTTTGQPTTAPQIVNS